MKSLLSDLDAQLPPFKAFYSLRKWPRGPLAGPRIISERSGLSYRTVQRLSGKITWSGIDVDVMSAFLAGCGWERCRGNIFNMRKQNALFRRSRNAVVPLARLNDNQFRRYDALCRLWLDANK